MAKQLQIRGGTTVQHSTFTGALREITIDTDKDVVVVHDGTTVGGFPLAKQTSVDSKVTKVTSTDNAIVRFNGVTGDVQNSGVIIDDNNNVGIGVTPSAWGSAYKALELGANGNGIYSYTSGTDMLISQNTYRDSLGNHRYVRSASATIYDLSSGVHVWYTAPSGTSGNAITWTNAMTLDVNGSYYCPRMYIDTTAAASNMSVNSAGQVMRSTSSKKYKTNIETIDNSYVDKFFDNARPIYYKSLSTNDNPNWGYWGFIAEEVAEVDKRLVHWRFDTKEIEVEKERVLEDETIEKYIEKEIVNDESKPMIAEGVMYERITVLLTAKVKEQQQIINDLKARIEVLESK